MKPTQEQAMVVGTAKDYPIVKVDAISGSGKAQPITCVVQAPKGEVKIGDLKVGDAILNASGGVSKVTGVFPQGVKEIYKVSLRDGMSTLCCLDHLWQVKPVTTRKGKQIVVPLSHILEKGVRTNANAPRFKIPLSEPVRYSTKELKIDPYVMGALLGDGSFKGKTVHLSYHEQDVFILNKVRGLLNPILLGDLVSNERFTSDKGKQSRLTTNAPNSNKTNEVVTLFQSFNFGSGKYMPREYLYGDVEQRLGVLRGLMDTDGTVFNNRVSFCNGNLDIMNAVVRLVQSLGGVCVWRKTDVRKSNPSYSVNVRMSINPFSLPRKANKWRPSVKNPPSRYITSVEPAGEAECVCISVDAEDHLYLTNDFIVTHNTATISMTAETLPLKSLYIAFNKVMADEAMSRMPDWVECRTTHSLAFRAVAGLISHKISRPQGAYQNVAGTGLEVANYYKLSNMPHKFEQKTVFSKTALGYFVLRTVRRFESSGDDYLAMSHTPYSDIEAAVKKAYDGYGDQVAESEKKQLIHQVRSDVLSVAERLWADRINPNSPVLITHDTYLKMFQLSKPKLDYEVIYLDEAQDTSDCVLALVMAQTHCKLIMVGDKYQAIYGWRGAVNAMEKIEAHTLPLTQSFRYGEAIAEVAYKVLQGAVPIKGNPAIASVVKLAEVACGELIDDGFEPTLQGMFQKYGSVTKIFRTNSGLLGEAMELLEAGVEGIEIRTDVKDFINMLYSAEALNKGDMSKVKHDAIVSYSDWEEFVEAAKDDIEVRRILNIQRKYGSFWHVINTLKGYVKPAKSNIILTTAHKSKGLEWPVVVLGEDYKPAQQIWDSQEETNLLYVASTRAIEVLVINATVEEMLYGN